MAKRARHEFRIKRVYDEPSVEDGVRFLVDRLWPRGVKKEALCMAGWLKEVAPSPSLRQWFGHDALLWPDFRRCYRAELKANPDAWTPLLIGVRKSTVTLLYAARDKEINHAVVLRDFLKEKTKQRQPTKERH